MSVRGLENHFCRTVDRPARIRTVTSSPQQSSLSTRTWA
ncbi:Hypothetical protein A7982_02036 [Minicystis rosea]|nr:Hypothetical protein A7982_02036 [Minicystis rosea]